MRVSSLYEDTPSDEAYRRWLEQDRYASTFLRCPPPRYDPILTPIFTSWFASLGFSATVSAFLGSAATALVTTAATIGLQMLLAPKPPKPEDGKIPKTQSVPHRWWGVGRVRVAGAYMLWESRDNMLYAVQAIAGHRIQSVNRYWLHDDEVTLDETGTTIINGSRYRNKVKIFYRLGLVPETPYEAIVDAFADEAPGSQAWTNDHRGDGQASLGMTVKAANQNNQAKNFPYGPPSLSVEADMALCWDFRDPAQDPEDPDTWEWTRNSALILAWHQCFNPFGHKRDYTRALVPVLDMWKEEADICDEDVPLNGGGTEKRYECNGFDTTENDPKVGTNAILATCDGWICERGDGALLFICGKFREKYVATITDADIVGHQIQYDVLFEDEINRLVPKFTYPAIDYATSDTDFFEDPDAILLAGRVLAQDGVYQWCHQWRQARRLGLRDWRRLKEKVSGALDLRLSAINAVFTRWVRLQTPLSLPRLSGKLVENRKSTLALLQGGFNMEIVQHPEDIDAWNPATDEGRQPPVPPKPNVDDIITPVINLVQAKASNGSVYIRVVIIDPEDDTLTPVVRYRVADYDGLGTPGAWIEKEFPDAVPSGGYVNLNTDVVPNDKLLDIQVSFKTSKGDGDWSATTTVASTVDTVAPLSLTSFTEASAGPHYGVAPFTIVTKSDTHLARVALYRTAAGGVFNATTDLVREIGVAPGSTVTYTLGVAPTFFTTNGDFSSAGPPPSLGTNCSISGGKGLHSSGAAGAFSWSTGALPVGSVVRYGGTIDSISGASASFTWRLLGGTTVIGTAETTAGFKSGFLTSVTGNTTFAPIASTNAVLQIDNINAFIQTADQEPRGTWDYRAAGVNGSGIAGPVSGPVTVTVI